MAIPNKITKAMVLAAGEGTRLRPLTLETPKPLLPVGGIPLIINQLLWLKYHGITELSINSHHLAEMLHCKLGNGSKWGITIHHSHEEKLLGTAGGVKKMEEYLDETFYVVYGDNLTDVNLTAMAAYHRKKNAFATIALFRHARPWEVGIVEIDDMGRLVGFTEKPTKGTEKSNFANAGIYIFEPEIFDHIPNEGYSDFGFDVFPKLLKDDSGIYGYIINENEYLIDIGTMEKYEQANDDAEAGRVKLYLEE